ncbi:hypothetical protein Esti_001586 [Eimeria stiedai]
MMSGESGGLRECYYSLLGIDMSATPEEVRRAYRRKAVEKHPDKNPNDPEATFNFQLLLEAYECLSDPQERAWYDSHRDRILGNVGSSPSGFAPSGMGEAGLNLWGFFASGSFRGFGDEEGGFFEVYRQLFARIYEREEEFKRRKGHDPPPQAPSFGSSKSPWEETGAFYSFWASFVSCRDFAEADQWSPKELAGASRAERRFLEKENQKLRKEAKKEFSETLRKLVQHVKRKDPRVQARQATLAQERLEEQRAREARQQELQQQQQLLRHQRQLEQQKFYEALKAERRALKKQGHAFADSSSSSSSCCSESDTEQQQQQQQEPERKRTDDEGFEAWYESCTAGGSPEGPLKLGSLGSSGFAAAVAVCLETAAQQQQQKRISSSSSKATTVVYVCEVCEKEFKSPQQYEAHARSAKHKKNLERLAAQLEEEFEGILTPELTPPQHTPHLAPQQQQQQQQQERAASTSGKHEETPELAKAHSQRTDTHTPRPSSESSSSGDSGSRSGESPSRRKGRRRKDLSSDESDYSSSSSGSSSSEEEDADEALLRFAKARSGQVRRSSSSQSSSYESNAAAAAVPSDAQQQDNEESLKAGRRRCPRQQQQQQSSSSHKDDQRKVEADKTSATSGREAGGPAAARGKAAAAAKEKETSCSVCGALFSSRNSLFTHIKKEGHAALKPLNAAKSRKRK